MIACGSVAARGSDISSRDAPSSVLLASSVYTTLPPRKYADAPGTASSAAAISPPDDDSATATVSLRAVSVSPTSAASSSTSAHDTGLAPTLTSALLLYVATPAASAPRPP